MTVQNVLKCVDCNAKLKHPLNVYDPFKSKDQITVMVIAVMKLHRYICGKKLKHCMTMTSVYEQPHGTRF